MTARIAGRGVRPGAGTPPVPADLLDVLPDAVVVLETGGRVGFINRAAETLTGWSRTDAIGRNCSEVVPVLDNEGRDLCSAAPLGRKLPLVKGLPEREYYLKRRSGEEILVSIRCTYDKDDAQVVRRVVCALRDARARKGMELRTVELISTVSHEIRSPLTSVKGFTKTLLDRWDRFDDDMKKEMLEAVNTDADRVKRLLEELLVISRLEAGRLRLNPQRVDLRELAKTVVGKLEGRSEKHTVTVRFPKSLPPVFADQDKIEQVLTNLVENAMKYTDGGTIKVTGKSAAPYIYVSVADEGSGIPRNALPSLFRKFVRRERAGSPSGTGLGLFICKGLIEAHGGEITATSKMGVGTTFTFRLPTQVEVP
jgi:hypothetical protein